MGEVSLSYRGLPKGRSDSVSEVMMTGTGYMYDEVPAIQNLNKVDGFDPRKYMRLIGAEGQPGKYYLDVAFRKMWFRLKYPEGKIVKKLLKLTEHVAIVEARVYLNRNDAEDNFISNALAQKYQTADEQFGNKFVELAETAAVGRALADAGFGLQFADKEGDMDMEVTDAPIDAGIFTGDYNAVYEGDCVEEVVGNVRSMEGETEMIPGQFGIESYIPIPDQVTKLNTQPARRQVPETVHVNPQQTESPVAPQVTIRKDMPVEQIYSMLNTETAASVVVTIGFNKGKTLGQIAVEKPASLEWYVNAYEGPDNLLRAAAKYLMDTALRQAS